jgi:anti-sigma regulatory factor (Ser/Thr protein kinase)
MSVPIAKIEETVRCVDSRDRFSCVSVATRIARAAGVSRRGALEIATAASELASNVVRHGGGGSVVIRFVEVPRPHIEIVAVDSGPGIDDVEAAMRDGWSAGRPRGPDDPRDGLGSGLGAVRRAMDAVLILAKSPRGTEVRAIRSVDRR